MNLREGAGLAADHTCEKEKRSVMEIPTFARKLKGTEIGRLIPTSQPIEVPLFIGEVVTLEGDRLGYRIICRRGRLWITQENDAADYVLEKDDEFVISKSGAVVIQGVQKSKALIQPPGITVDLPQSAPWPVS